jgi:hypothetical protein
LPVEIRFCFKSTGFTSSTFPIQPDFSQNQPATNTLNTGSSWTLAWCRRTQRDSGLLLTSYGRPVGQAKVRRHNQDHSIIIPIDSSKFIAKMDVCRNLISSRDRTSIARAPTFDQWAQHELTKKQKHSSLLALSTYN